MYLGLPPRARDGGDWDGRTSLEIMSATDESGADWKKLSSLSAVAGPGGNDNCACERSVLFFTVQPIFEGAAADAEFDLTLGEYDVMSLWCVLPPRGTRQGVPRPCARIPLTYPFARNSCAIALPNARGVFVSVCRCFCLLKLALLTRDGLYIQRQPRSI